MPSGIMAGARPGPFIVELGRARRQADAFGANVGMGARGDEARQDERNNVENWPGRVVLVSSAANRGTWFRRHRACEVILPVSPTNTRRWLGSFSVV